MRPLINQNCVALCATLNSIIMDKTRLNAAISMLGEKLDENDDPFVLIYMKENESFPFYDRERRVASVIRGATDQIKGRGMWRIIDVYRELSTRPSLYFNRCLDRYVLSRPSNDAITMRDMDMLLYDATMPFSHSKHEGFLSVQFRMAYDFLHLLREQHCRFCNAKQYIEMIKLALNRPNKSSTADENRLIEFPFDTLMMDAFLRTEPDESTRRILPIRVINRLCYLDLVDSDETMRRVLLMERYLYDNACDVLYVKFQSQLGDMILSQFKQIHGLFGSSPLALSANI